MIETVDLGVISYAEGLKQQKHYFQKKITDSQAPDYLLLLEHTPVFTFGKRDSSDDLLVKKAWLKSQGFDVVKADRGGRVTYHGPGQIVGYLICSVKAKIPDFVFRVEQKIIDVLKSYEIQGGRDSEYPGVWVENNKIAALGFRIEKGISRHGFSLNMSCDLAPYAYILPCGISHRGVTSVQKEKGYAPDLSEAKKIIQTAFKDFRK